MTCSPKKKKRGLKRYYRDIRRKVSTFALDLGEAHWYDRWHMHVDSNYVSVKGASHRREHIKLLFDLYANFAAQLRAYPHPYQLWISWNADEERNSAVYIHTDNPNFERSKDISALFPWPMRDIAWNCAVPELLDLLFQPEEMVIGKYMTSPNAYLIIAKNSELA